MTLTGARLAAKSETLVPARHAELLLRQAELEILDHDTLRTPERDPLYWTGLLGDATIFLLVRDDLPLDDRLRRAAARADLIPRLARQAREALAAAAPSGVSAELCSLAVRQARASAELYRASFPKAAEGRSENIREQVGESGRPLQDEQFAGNMWVRAITSSPQLTFYHLGYRQVMGLYEDVRKAKGEAFDLRAFMDGMMEMGPVPVTHYRRRMLPE